MKKILAISGFFILCLIFVFNSNSLNLLMNNENENIINSNNGLENSDKLLSCLDLIDIQLSMDGFQYLVDGKWGRGHNNSFIIDLINKEYYMANTWSFDNIPSDWYEDNFDLYNLYTYNYSNDQLWDTTLDQIAQIVTFRSDGDYSRYYELPIWMEYYTTQMNNFGCTIEELNEEILLGEYKSKISTARFKDIVSVFDRISDDDIMRYFSDVHKTGEIEENILYKELDSYKDLKELYKAGNGENRYIKNFDYVINFIYKNPSLKVFYDVGLSGSILKEFTKDVVFDQQLLLKDEKNNNYFEVYFINIDNPNKEFEDIYIYPTDDLTKLRDLYDLHSPLESFFLFVSKDVSLDGDVFNVGYDIFSMEKNLEYYMSMLKKNDYNLEYSDDFILNYTRPFNDFWQSQMGLQDLFDEKYGFIDRTIEYTDEIYK